MKEGAGWHERNRLIDKLKDVESPELFRATIGFDFVFAPDKTGKKRCYCVELNGQESGTWGVAEIEGVDNLRKVMTLSRNAFNPGRQQLRVAIERIRGTLSEAERSKKSLKNTFLNMMEEDKQKMPLVAHAFVNPPEIETVAEDKALHSQVIPPEYRLRTYVEGESAEAGSGYWMIKPRAGRRGDSIRVVTNAEFASILAGDDILLSHDDLLRFNVAQEYVRAQGADLAPRGYEGNPASMRLLVDFRVLEDGTIHIVHEDGYQRVGPLPSRQYSPADTSMSVVNKARGAKAVDMSKKEFDMAHEAALKIINNIAGYYEKHRSHA